jgi:hypothetical protein
LLRRDDLIVRDVRSWFPSGLLVSVDLVTVELRRLRGSVAAWPCACASGVGVARDRLGRGAGGGVDGQLRFVLFVWRLGDGGFVVERLVDGREVGFGAGELLGEHCQPVSGWSGVARGLGSAVWMWLAARARVSAT